MKNTELFKLAQVFKKTEKTDELCDIFDEIADTLIEDEEVRAWFYSVADIIRPEMQDDNCIS